LREVFFFHAEFFLSEGSQRPFKTLSRWEDKTITKEESKKGDKTFFHLSITGVLFSFLYFHFAGAAIFRSEKREVNYSNFKLCEIHSNECIWMESFSTLHKALN
jgi:maltose-binding protein MalE